MEHCPTAPKFLVPECMAHEQSYWYQFLVPETRAENLGHVSWALLVMLFVCETEKQFTLLCAGLKD